MKTEKNGIEKDWLFSVNNDSRDKIHLRVSNRGWDYILQENGKVIKDDELTLAFLAE